MECLEKLLEENKKLIYSISKYFDGDKEDLFQVGVLGFIRAYKNYIPNKEVKFTTYAFPYILGEMKKYRRENKIIKVNKEINQLNKKIEEAINFLEQRLMREPSIKEISIFLEIEETYIEEAIKSRNFVNSLDDVLSEDNSLSLYDILEDKSNMPLENMLALKEAISNLSDEEKQIINSRYFEDKTQTQISNVLGINQVQVSRKEKKALQKLKTYF